MVASVIDDGGSANSDNVRVVVRCRPLSETEVANGHESAVDIDEDAMTITVRSSELLPKTFAFDAIFGPASSQLDVYNRAARPIIENVLEGYNGKWCWLVLFVYPIIYQVPYLRMVRRAPAKHLRWLAIVRHRSCAESHQTHLHISLIELPNRIRTKRIISITWIYIYTNVVLILDFLSAYLIWKCLFVYRRQVIN
jgi:hypothetical protein